MSAIWSKRLFGKLINKKYRAAYVEENVQTGIAYQLRTLRGNSSQEEFGKKINKPQSVISRIEDPDYGKLSIQTLLDIATSLDIALLVKFVSFPEFIQQTRDVSIEGLQVPSFAESLSAYTTLTDLNATVKHIKTSTTLIKALQDSAAKKTNPTEILAQRVSFVMGSLKQSSTMTHEQVLHFIKKQEGDEE